MAMTTTFDRPNYVGQLFQISPTDTPFTSIVGGMNGGRPTKNKLFSWQYDSLSNASATGKTEGAAPTYSVRTRSEMTNVVQIFDKGVELTYSALGNLDLLAADAGTAGGTDANGQPILGQNPIANEMSHQLKYKMLELKRDIEYTFLNGTYQNPASNAAARQTRGILAAISTNEIALDAGASAPADLAGSLVDSGTDDATLGAPIGFSYIDNLLKDMFDNGAPLIDVVVFMNSFQYVKASRAYSNAGALVERSRTVGGMDISTIVTNFATVSLVLNRWMPTDEVLACDVSVVYPRFYEVPGKGYFFTEEKPSDGASVKMMIYGEIGLEYGPETHHGKITNLTTS